jgi:outer membrane lipoprotein-sorting protein
MMRTSLLLILCFFCVPCARGEVSPEEILRKSDEIRLPSKDYTMLARVTSSKPGTEAKTGIYEVLSKGRERSVIKTLAPATDKDRILLMREENLWAYLPNVSKPLRISLRDRLLGEVANADIARANFYGDYTATLLTTEKIKGVPYSVLNHTKLSSMVCQDEF